MNCGHLVECIQINTQFTGEPVKCKYCGLRYALASHNDHNHHESHDHSNCNESHKQLGGK
jgi:hypothetical protein